VIFYHQKLDNAGEPMLDQYGIAMVDCSRGTNDTECVHKQIITTFGTWCAGIEMSNCLILEFRHRYNQRASERRRAGYPKLGHYDTWLIDMLQRLYELNHSAQFLPGWSNTSDYVNTPEQFDTVPLHSAALGEAMAGIEVGNVKLSADRKYLAEKMGLKLPPLPVHGAHAKSVVSRDPFQRSDRFNPCPVHRPGRVQTLQQADAEHGVVRVERHGH